MSFWNNSVDGLLSDFTKLVTRLEQRANVHSLQAAYHTEQQAVHAAATKAELALSVKAGIIADRIKKIISV